MSVRFSQSGIRFQLAQRRRLKQFLEDLCKREKKQLTELSIVFCTNQEIRTLNRKYLGIFRFTDILGFDMGTGADQIRAELYISIDQVRENAHTYGISFDNELHRVIIHGILHFCGYNDKKPEEQKIMERREDRYLQLYYR